MNCDQMYFLSLFPHLLIENNCVVCFSRLSLGLGNTMHAKCFMASMCIVVSSSVVQRGVGYLVRKGPWKESKNSD